MGKRIIFIVRLQFVITNFNTSVNNFPYSSECLGKNIQLLTEKGINQYSCITYFERFTERMLPPRKCLHNTFDGKNGEYQYALLVCEIIHVVRYHCTYVKSNTLLRDNFLKTLGKMRTFNYNFF